MPYVNPWLFDTQNAGDLLAAGGGWEGKFLTAGSSWTKIQNTGIWPSSVWVRRAVLHNLTGTTEADRERCLATYNSMGQGINVGSDSGPGVTLWQYEEFYLPSTSFPSQFAGGSWNFFAINWHHGSGVNGSTGQVPFHIGATDARGRGFYELYCQVRGGLQISSSNSGSTSPNEEDFILDSPLKYNHIYRVMVRMTLAPNGTAPQRNRFLVTNLPGSYIVPFTTGDSHGRVEVWVDDVLKVSKRRPTSYYDLNMYTRSDTFGRNPDKSASTDAIFYATKRTQARTRTELFATIEPTVVDTFQDGGDSTSGGGGNPPPPTGAVLPALPAGKVRYGVFNSDGTAPGARGAMGSDRIRASGPIAVNQALNVDKIYFHIESADTGTQVFKVVVWDDDGTNGEPLTRLFLSTEISKTAPFAATWQEISIGPALTLPAGNYWVGVHSGGTTNIIDYAYEDVSNTYRSIADTYADGTPTTWPGGSTSDRIKMAFVLEGTAPSGGSGDTTRPIVDAAEVTYAELALQVSEEIQVSSAPTASAFAVRVNGLLTAASSLSLSADIVTLFLASPVAAGDVVTVSFDSNLTTNQVRDLAGNAMVSFSEFPVSNTTPPEEVDPNYTRVIALTRTVDPSKRIVNPSNRIVGRERPVWT
jgi:flagellar associated repeat protein